MKTPIQQAIEQIQTKIAEYDGVDNAATCFNEAVLILQSLVQHELDVIENACRDWHRIGYTDGENNESWNVINIQMSFDIQNYLTEKIN